MVEIIKDYFIIIPILFLIITVMLIIKLLKQKREFREQDGVIIDFYENNNELRLKDYEHKKTSPIISYEVNGNKFEFVGNYYSTTMKKGDKIKIVYNTKNPKQAKVKNGLIFAIIILSIFTISSFIALLLIKKFL